MRDCPNGEMRDLLPELMHGRLDAAAAAAVEAHVHDCDDCRTELALLSNARLAVLAATRPIDVDAIVTRLPQPGGASARFRLPSRAWQLAASLVLAVGVGATVLSRDAETPSIPGHAAASAPSAAAAPAVDAPPTVAVRAGATTRTRVAALRELAPDATLPELTTSELQSLLDGLRAVDGVPVAEPDAVGITGTTILEEDA